MPVYQELKYKDGDPDPALNELLAVRIWVYWPCQLKCRCYKRKAQGVWAPSPRGKRGLEDFLSQRCPSSKQEADETAWVQGRA